MKHTEKIRSYITQQLAEQGFEFSILSRDETHAVEKQWKEKFLGNLSVDELKEFKWHTFS